MNKHSKFGILVAVVVGLALVASGPDVDNKQAELDQYCQMVALHKQDQSVGWPDFNNNYDEVCK